MLLLLLVICFVRAVQRILVFFKGTCACVGCHNASACCHHEHKKCWVYICIQSVACGQYKPIFNNVNKKERYSVWLLSFLVAVKLNPYSIYDINFMYEVIKRASADPLFMTSAPLVSQSPTHHLHKQNKQASYSLSRQLCSHYYFIFCPSFVSLLFCKQTYKRTGKPALRLFAPCVYSSIT